MSMYNELLTNYRNLILKKILNIQKYHDFLRNEEINGSLLNEVNELFLKEEKIYDMFNNETLNFSPESNMNLLLNRLSESYNQGFDISSFCNQNIDYNWMLINLDSRLCRKCFEDFNNNLEQQKN